MTTDLLIDDPNTSTQLGSVTDETVTVTNGLNIELTSENGHRTIVATYYNEKPAIVNGVVEGSLELRGDFKRGTLVVSGKYSLSAD